MFGFHFCVKLKRLKCRSTGVSLFGQAKKIKLYVQDNKAKKIKV